MDHQSNTRSTTLPIISKPKVYSMMNSEGGGRAPKSPSSIRFKIRLFHVCITPCAIDAAPYHLTLRHLREELGVSVEINGTRVPASETAPSTLCRDRVDRDSSEVIYVSTDSVKISGSMEF